jgi:hypothetical protein
MGDNCLCCKHLRLKEKTIPAASQPPFLGSCELPLTATRLEQTIGLRFADYWPTPSAECLASEWSEYPASAVGRRTGCIRG